MLTDQRLCLVVHYLFRPDQGFEFPRGSFVGVRRTGLPGLRFLRLNYRTADGRAHLDVTAVGGGRTIFVGESIDAQHLLEAIQQAWGPDAPVFAPC
jgi:hypothetical protein